MEISQLRTRSRLALAPGSPVSLDNDNGTNDPERMTLGSESFCSSCFLCSSSIENDSGDVGIVPQNPLTWSSLCKLLGLTSDPMFSQFFATQAYCSDCKEQLRVIHELMEQLDWLKEKLSIVRNVVVQLILTAYDDVVHGEQVPGTSSSHSGSKFPQEQTQTLSVGTETQSQVPGTSTKVYTIYKRARTSEFGDLHSDTSPLILVPQSENQLTLKTQDTVPDDPLALGTPTENASTATGRKRVNNQAKLQGQLLPVSVLPVLLPPSPLIGPRLRVPTQCPHCPAIFRRSIKLQLHIQSQHPEIVSLAQSLAVACSPNRSLNPESPAQVSHVPINHYDSSSYDSLPETKRLIKAETTTDQMLSQLLLTECPVSEAPAPAPAAISKSKLNNPQRIIRKRKPRGNTKCFHCPAKFARSILLELHMKKSHPIELKKNPGNNLVFKTRYGGFLCPCGRDYMSQQALNRHIYSMHFAELQKGNHAFAISRYSSPDLVRIKCPICYSKFNNPVHFETHYEKVHLHEEIQIDQDGESRTVLCSICDESFTFNLSAEGQLEKLVNKHFRKTHSSTTKWITSDPNPIDNNEDEEMQNEYQLSIQEEESSTSSSAFVKIENTGDGSEFLQEF